MKRFLLALVFVLVASSARAQVGTFTNSTAPCTQSGINLATGITCTNLTIPAGANLALVCQVNTSLHSPASEAVNWDSAGTPQPMTQIKGQDTASGAGRAELWVLVNPTVGNKTAKYTAVGTSDVDINCVSMTGVDQTGSTTTFYNATSATGNSSTSSVTVTSASGDATFDDTVNNVNLFSAPSQTQTFNDGLPAAITGAGSRDTTSGASITHSWSIAAVGQWASVGVSVKAAAGGASCSAGGATLTLTGVSNCK